MGWAVAGMPRCPVLDVLLVGVGGGGKCAAVAMLDRQPHADASNASSVGRLCIVEVRDASVVFALEGGRWGAGDVGVVSREVCVAVALLAWVTKAWLAPGGR